MQRDAPCGDGPPGASSRVWVCAAVLLAAAAFAAHARNALRFEELGAFAQYDLLFDTDPNIRLRWFADGWWNAGSWEHALAGPLVHWPIKALGRLASLAGLTADEAALRVRMALLAVPLVSALRVPLLLSILRRFGATPLRASAAAVADQTAFATLAFACQPDHFALTSAATLAAFAVWTAPGARSAWRESAVGAALAGITVTNLLPFAAGVAFGDRAAGRPWGRTILRGAAVAGAALAVVAAAVLLDTRKEPAAGAAGASRFAAKWLKDDPAAAAAAFPWTVRDASLAAPPGRGPNRLAEAKGSRHPWGFSLERSGRSGPAAWISLAAVLALLAAGFRALWMRGGAWRGVGAAAACWIGFHHALHSVWGAGETFLYAPHWVGAQSLLVGAAAVAWRPRSRAATAAVWLLAACAAAWNLRNIGLMLDALR